MGYRDQDGGVDGRPSIAGFEDVFRGREERVADLQRVYVELIGDREPVLDFGCGRGEFLDLLQRRASRR